MRVLSTWVCVCMCFCVYSYHKNKITPMKGHIHYRKEQGMGVGFHQLGFPITQQNGHSLVIGRQRTLSLHLSPRLVPHCVRLFPFNLGKKTYTYTHTHTHAHTQSDT